MARKRKSTGVFQVPPSEALVHSIAGASPDALIFFRDDATILGANSSAESLFGWRQRELIGKPVDQLFTSTQWLKFRGSVLTSRDVVADRPEPAMLELRGLHKEGKTFPAQVSLSRFRTGSDWITTAFIRDISRQKRLEKALARLSVRDSLTDLSNRRYFSQRIRAELMNAGPGDSCVGLLLCDLDHFKRINEDLGYKAGDRILRDVARQIRTCTRRTDLVFRWGEDEFLAVLSRTTRHGALSAAERIRQKIGELCEKNRFDLGISVGIAFYPEHGTAVNQLIQVADRALFIAKRAHDRIHVGAEEYNLGEDSIKVLFQPIVDIQSTETIGYEALSRDPKGQSSILDLFKKYEAIGHLNELKCLCFQLQLKSASCIGLKRVFLNVDFNVLGRLNSIRKPAEMDVILEISELEALHDIETYMKASRRWRELGYKFAIDDFGAGFISLPFLARLMPDYIKIDRSTLLQAATSEKFRRFCGDLFRAIRNYSKHGIIAEGIETRNELGIIREMGIHLAQGFYLGKPQELQPTPEQTPTPYANP